MNYVKNILRIRGNNMLSKELFVKVINGLEKFEKTALKINESLKDYFMDFNIIPSYFEQLILELLEAGMNDKYEWISYYLYELDYGHNFKMGDVTEEDGTNIDISTPEKLYDFIVEEYKDENIK